MAKRELVIHIVSGDWRLGLWCDTCLTSARCEVGMYHLASDGPHLIGTFAHCVRCQADDDD